MSEIEITCPSGLAGRVRGMKGKDFRAFNKQTSKTGEEGITRVLQACWSDTTAIGPYKQPLIWDDVLLGDRLYAFIGVRRAMYPGEPYVFKLTCKEARCRQPIEWQIDLVEQLPVRALPKASFDAVAAGKNEFRVELEAGLAVWFKLMTGRDQVAMKRQIQRAISQNPLERPSDLVLSLASRLIRVEGVEGTDDFRARVEWLEELDVRHHLRMVKLFETHDCGVETLIEVVCPHCSAQQEVELPFESTFLTPR